MQNTKAALWDYIPLMASLSSSPSLIRTLSISVASLPAFGCPIKYFSPLLWFHHLPVLVRRLLATVSAANQSAPGVTTDDPEGLLYDHMTKPPVNTEWQAEPPMRRILPRMFSGVRYDDFSRTVFYAIMSVDLGFFLTQGPQLTRRGQLYVTYVTSMYNSSFCNVRIEVIPCFLLAL